MVTLDGAVAVVTGGAGGIGLALARRLSDDGARVAIVDLHESAAKEAAAAVPGALGIGADVGDGAAVRSMVEQVRAELGPIEVYCSNAGIAGGDALGSASDWERTWRVHTLAHVYAAEAVLPAMAERQSGALVITASAAGLLMMMQSATYTVTKHAAVALAEWLAVDYGGRGVQLHCLCPQGVRTSLVTSDARSEAEVTASGRLLEPPDVADAVVDALRANRFLVLPHPEVHGYEEAKVADRDRWLAGMRRLKARIANSAP
jgi:NAD(P)-dependent dehydrogenase (short-subunit alcohol dehydrogenase family)